MTPKIEIPQPPVLTIGTDGFGSNVPEKPISVSLKKHLVGDSDVPTRSGLSKVPTSIRLVSRREEIHGLAVIMDLIGGDRRLLRFSGGRRLFEWDTAQIRGFFGGHRFRGGKRVCVLRFSSNRGEHRPLFVLIYELSLTVSTGNYDHNLWCSIWFLTPPSGRDPAW